jgi:hypothetical protein
MPIRQRQEVEGEFSTEKGNHFLFTMNLVQDLRGNSQRLLLQINLLAVAVAQVEDLLTGGLCLFVCCVFVVLGRQVQGWERGGGC